MKVIVTENPNGSSDNKEATWWKNWLGKKREVHDKNSETIEKLREQYINLRLKQQQKEKELAELCEEYDTLVKQIAVAKRTKNKSDHRRLEVEE